MLKLMLMKMLELMYVCVALGSVVVVRSSV